MDDDVDKKNEKINKWKDDPLPWWEHPLQTILRALHALRSLNNLFGNYFLVLKF